MQSAVFVSNDSVYKLESEVWVCDYTSMMSYMVGVEVEERLGLSMSRGIFLGLVSPGPALRGSGLAAFGVVLLKGLMDLRGLSGFVPCG